MSNRSETKKKKKTPAPSFTPTIPLDINPSNDADAGDEPTRRVAVAPAFDSPHFAATRSDQLTGKDQIAFGAAPPALRQGASIGKHPPKGLRRTEYERRERTIPTLAGKRTGPWPLNDIPMLPEFHPLERTAVFVQGSSASEIASRISNVLRERSIEATYDNKKAKAICMTADQVDFRIRLYRGKKQYRNGIIVEVQRRSGSSIHFFSDTMAILNAAEGKASSVQPPTIDLPMVSDADDDFDSTSSGSSLEIVAKMLRAPGHDTHNLALQTLSSLTDPTKMGKKTAFAVSKKLLEPDNEVGAKVVSLLVDKKQDPEETSALRAMAMMSLSNAIQVVNGDLPEILREKLRPFLIQQLRDAANNPQMAYLAARCIEPLIRDEYEASEFYGPLEKAQSVGQARHAALAQQAETCIKLIDSR